MIVNGRELKQKIVNRLKERVRDLPNMPTLVAFYFEDSKTTSSYIGIKEKTAEAIGVNFLREGIGSEEELRDKIMEYGKRKDINGILVQLPLPAGFNADAILGLIPKEKDPDVLSGKAEENEMLSPVVGAVKEILDETHLPYRRGKIVVVGDGRLVGRPIARWLTYNRVPFDVIDVETTTKERARLLRDADLIISGVGEAHIIKPEDIKEGVAIIDAGVGEIGGSLSGDAHPACAKKAKLFTPVPGGVGPVVVAKLFENLVELSTNKD